MNWYAIHTKPGREEMVSALLKQSGLEVYVPRVKAKKYHAGKYRSVVEPLFPNYIFTRFESETHHWMVSYTRGVRKVLGGSEGPWPVPGQIIDFFRSSEIGGVITVRERDIQEGDEVRITDGPFSGLRAVLQRYIEGTERALLLLKALEYQAQVVVDRALLIKTS